MTNTQCEDYKLIVKDIDIPYTSMCGICGAEMRHTVTCLAVNNKHTNFEMTHVHMCISHYTNDQIMTMFNIWLDSFSKTRTFLSFLCDSLKV